MRRHIVEGNIARKLIVTEYTNPTLIKMTDVQA